MEVKKFTIPSTNGKDILKCYNYHPIGEVKGIIQISHGMCEHFMRYKDFAKYMTEKGFIVCGHDHLGHGSTASTERDEGFFADESGWEYVVRDLFEISKYLKKNYKGKPLFILGHSMGSFILRLYLSSYGHEIDGAIVVGTSGKNSLIKFGIALSKMTMSLQGSRHRSLILDKLAFGTYNAKIRPHRTKFDWLSRDTEVVDKYLADPKCGFVFTAAGFIDLFSMLKEISSKGWAASVNKDLPVILMSGDMDPVGEYGDGVRRVYNALQRAGVKDLKIKLYPGARHEILNEINRSEVFEDILSWITAKI